MRLVDYNQNLVRINSNKLHTLQEINQINYTIYYYIKSLLECAITLCFKIYNLLPRDLKNEIVY